MKMDYPIIDLHCHPFLRPEDNSGLYHYSTLKTPDDFRNGLAKTGIKKFCGSVIVRNDAADMKFLSAQNQNAMDLQKIYGESYVPGIHIHPDHGDESCREIAERHRQGVRLIGELVPYMHGYAEYTQGDGMQIFDLAQSLGMAVNIHPTNPADMEELLSDFPKLIVVIAHPGERPDLLYNIELMKRFPNARLDISGTGLFRDGLLRFVCDAVGSERILFATDYPICNPAMQAAGVMFEDLSEIERENIFYRNARDLLGIS